MPFTLDNVVPWGRSLDEYVRMFDLEKLPWNYRLLGCADGPAAFNAGWTRCGRQMVSCDPLYYFTPAEIQGRIDACFEMVLQQTRENSAGFVWNKTIPDVKTLGQVRSQAMQTFLRDYPHGLKEGRYVAAELPDLPFPDNAFDVALCSHFLFLYGALGAEFHRRSIASLLRVASEVRIFPLLQLDRQPSPFVQDVIRQVKSEGHTAEIVRVPYEFQKGADQMLVLRKESR
ncbi:SAM-dependent methyltransferase [Blastopirellula marina]|uniref:SAM-dependent methyltransferase n=1 Tax=Blastopirellula marina TaxID=124 RepID=A0A2S8F7D9_9BACT|nr:SAM-dependent methyltransferase [Blastopirellula marina]PQO27854.1 SAM-dependent methyltransferase [Blastopirellula marina]PTL41589.1 SAM-dependent methyltransferase [Blastopirellula marina]